MDDPGQPIGHDEAELCVLLLVDGTGKNAWDDGAVALYTNVFANYRDLDLLAKACVAALQLEYFGKPSLPQIKEQYDLLLRRRQDETREAAQTAFRRQLTGGRLPTFAEGVEIALSNYRQTVTAAGKEPDEEFCRALLGDGREERRFLARTDRHRR